MPKERSEAQNAASSLALEKARAAKAAKAKARKEALLVQKEKPSEGLSLTKPEEISPPKGEEDSKGEEEVNVVQKESDGPNDDYEANYREAQAWVDDRVSRRIEEWERENGVSHSTGKRPQKGRGKARATRRKPETDDESNVSNDDESSEEEKPKKARAKRKSKVGEGKNAETPNVKAEPAPAKPEPKHEPKPDPPKPSTKVIAAARKLGYTCL